MSRPQRRSENRYSRGAGSRADQSEVDDEMPMQWSRPLALRLLALVGAASFVMIGLSVVIPLLQPQPPQPRPLPGSAPTATS